MIFRWFWAFLQHISAPSEKEIRTKLLALVAVVLLSLAPAMAEGGYPTPANVHANMDEAREVEIHHQTEEIKDALMQNMIYLPGTRVLKSDCILDTNTFDSLAIEGARAKFLAAGWACTYTQIDSSRVRFSIWETK